MGHFINYAGYAWASADVTNFKNLDYYSEIARRKPEPQIPFSLHLACPVVKESRRYWVTAGVIYFRHRILYYSGIYYVCLRS